MTGSPVWLFLAAGLVAIADQAIKLLVLSTRPRLTVIPGFFAIVFATNTGAAFSILREFPGALTALGLVVLAGLAVHVLRRGSTFGRWERAGFALVMGGAAGNVADRLRLGYVVDYLDLFVGDYHWPAFNLADSALTSGVACLVIASFRGRAGDREREASAHRRAP